MRWSGGREGGNIEDRRGMGRTAAGGGIGVLVIGLIAHFVFGLSTSDTAQVMEQLGDPQAQESARGAVGAPQDSAGKFVDVVATNLDDVWSAQIRGYTSPKVVLYDQGTTTGCGYGQTAMGPFYCPNDATVYLDLSFWHEMEALGGSSAEFARAYVIAHEFGHHVQQLTATPAQLEQRGSVAVELQADCFAGVWAANASAASGGQVALEPGDLQEGLRSAQAIGDDALQRRAGKQVSPEQFTHGSSAERVAALERGYRVGKPAACSGDTR